MLCRLCNAISLNSCKTFDDVRKSIYLRYRVFISFRHIMSEKQKALHNLLRNAGITQRIKNFHHTFL